MWQHFHELTVPHLYTSVVIDTLPSFLTHLEDAPPSLFNKITSKVDRITFVQQLRITTIGIPCKRQVSILHLLSGTLDWDLVAENVMGFSFRRVKMAFDESRALIELLEWYRDSKLPFAMPLLDTVILGQIGGCTWDNLFKIPTMLSHSHLISEAQASFTEFILRLNPRVICCHSVSHPYALQFSDSNPKCDTALICIHHYYQFGFTPVTICPGKRQRHYFDPLGNAMLQYPNVDVGMIDLYDSAAHIAAVDPRGGANTSIELMGFYTTPACVSPDPSDLVDVFDAGRHPELSAHNRGKWKRAREKEAIMTEEHKPEIISRLPHGWGKRIVLQPWGEVPPCEGCGWTTGDFLGEKSHSFC